MKLLHRILLRDPASHLVDVETTVTLDGDPGALTLFMPVWTPGSYLVREYARHIEALSVDSPATATKVRKNAWHVEPNGKGALSVRYRLYCNDLTVRTNHVDDTHAFLNGAATFLAVEGHEGAPSRVEVIGPAGWRVASSLRATASTADTRDDALAVLATLEAPDLDTLVDCPIEAGAHRAERFDVLGKVHRFAIWPAPAISDADVARLVADTTKILQTEGSLFGNALPYDDYLFLLHLSPRGRGGLEHRTSATLLASPSTFATRDGYLDLLSLVSHEAFHLWNVKRLRPGGLFPYRYQEENYTRLLWWFEGATSYFDWRVLRLAELCTVQEYLDHLAGEIAYLDLTHGRLVSSLEDASFDAWIKLYRPDENSQNSSVSYYRKGEIVCALFDLEIRARSSGKASLDRVMSHLWETYGARDVPVPEGGMQEIFERVAGVPLGDLFDAWVRSAQEIDYGATLAKAGLVLERSPRPDAPACSLGVRLRSDGGRCIVSTVVRGAAAQRAGIDPGDEIFSIAGRRVDAPSLDAALARKAAGETVEVVLARDGRTLVRSATLDGPRTDRVKLVAAPSPTNDVARVFAEWLGEPHPNVATQKAAAQ